MPISAGLEVLFADGPQIIAYGISGIPEMISSRLQHWVIILLAYAYEVKCKPSQQYGNVDGLSHLPLELGTVWTGDTENIVCLLEQQKLN